jgi:hypothetical protein
LPEDRVALARNQVAAAKNKDQLAFNLAQAGHNIRDIPLEGDPQDGAIVARANIRRLL